MHARIARHDLARHQTSRTRRIAPWLAAGTAALAGAALFNRAAADRAERDYPPTGRFLDIDGVRLHYVERGEGSPVVIIHGNASLTEEIMISGLVDRLAASHRVVLFDRPGYGYTTRPRGGTWTPERQAGLFAEASRRLGLVRPVLYGHSWGTLAVLAWALDHPAEVGGLVLASGYYYPTARLDALLQSPAASTGLGDVLTSTVLPLQGRLTGPLGVHMMFSPADATDAFTDGMPFGLLLRPGQLRATSADSAQMPFAAAGLAKRYGELDLPMAIVWGDGDKLVGQDGQSARLAAQFPGAHALELEGVGHMVHHTAPDRIAGLIETVAAEASA